MSAPLRPVLGDMNSIICFRAMVIGVENILGSSAFGTLVSAGKLRGRAVVESLGASGVGLDRARELLDGAVGLEGTRLCMISDVKVEDDGAKVIVCISESICSAGEPKGSSRRLTFTLGAIHGAIEQLSGRSYKSLQVGSVLRGQDYDIVELTRKD